jgi:hypothetical protein
MPLIYAGIDEAGYGPMLGPLCVGLAVFRIESHEPGGRAPDLWALLRSGVCRSLGEQRGDRRHRVAIADSKKLKLPNRGVSRHPLLHLERAVLSLLRSVGVSPSDDAHLLAALGARLPGEAWYAGGPIPLPIAGDARELGIASNVLSSSMSSAGVSLEELRCTVVGEEAFNATVRETGSKAEVTARAIGAHLRLVRERWGGGGAEVRIACDRLGGRTGYADLLARELPGVGVRAIAESAELSVYDLGAGPRPARVQFMADSESAHLPVAAASIAAKLVRELAMLRFNRHFSGLQPELRPTAGYVADARRWLEDARGTLDAPTRRRLVRLA